MLRSADGVNSVRLLGLLQPQFAFNRVDGAGHGAFLVNRARVGLIGNVLSEDLNYSVRVQSRDGRDVQDLRL